MFSAITTPRIRGGYGIYFVREDVGTADQLSFQAPFLPIAFGPGAPDVCSTFFVLRTPAQCPTIRTSTACRWRACSIGNSCRVLGPSLDFPNGTSQLPDFGCANGSAGLVPSNSCSRSPFHAVLFRRTPNSGTLRSSATWVSNGCWNSATWARTAFTCAKPGRTFRPSWRPRQPVLVSRPRMALRSRSLKTPSPMVLRVRPQRS